MNVSDDNFSFVFMLADFSCEKQFAKEVEAKNDGCINDDDNAVLFFGDNSQHYRNLIILTKLHNTKEGETVNKEDKNRSGTSTKSASAALSD